MAAQDAELKLKVSLDLAFFRQQLTGLGQAAAGYNLPINVRIDRGSIQKELNALGANFKRRNYTLEVKTNLDNEIKKAKDLRDLLAGMPAGNPGKPGAIYQTPGTKARASALMQTLAMPGKGGFDANAIKALAQKAVDVGLKGVDPSKSTTQLRKDLRIAFDQAGDDATRGLINSLLDGRTSVGKAATGLGEGILAALRTSLKTQSPSKETRKIGKDTADGLEIELIKGLDKIEGRVDGKVKEILASLKQLAMIRGFMTGGFSMEGIRGQQQNMANFAKMLMASAGGMAGIIRMPGGFQERGRLQQRASGINAAMTGGAFANIRARQQGARGQAAAAASTTPSFMAALPLMMGMKPGELKSRLQGLYGQQFRAPQMGGYARPNEQKIDKLINYLARSASGRGSLGEIVSGTGARSGILPGTSSAGYIGRSALSAAYVNYPPGMPAAYGTGFTGGGGGRYGMAQGRMQGPILPVQGVFSTARGSLGQFPTAGPMAPSPRHAPSLGYIDQANRNTAFSAMGGVRASFALYGGKTTAFPMSGMMVPSSPYGQINAQTSMFGPNGPAGPGNRPPGGIFGGYGGRGGGGGIIPPGGFPSNGMMGPQSQLGQGYFAAGKAINSFSKSFAAARSYLNQNRLPLGGAIAEVGSEFGNAVKQVLLFGTAYKALAFLTDLPNQAFEAAKGLATYRNQLQAVTGDAAGFERSFAFVDNLATRFNVPLESARQGFVKLYASMKPAGFSAGEIEGLFTGISKATAAFGLSADKVDRVNYAFAQMASKGQIMSEELKGQLGDVLPGALALFAEAAQMDIPEFSKAMEDGAFKGDAMRQVLDNVAILMNRKFGPAAQGAAKTLQGSLNQIQNNLKLMYESMTPIVNQFAATFGPQVNSLIKDVTSTMQVLTGTFAKGSDAVGTLSPRAQAFYNVIQQLRPSIESAGLAIAEMGRAVASFIPFAVKAVSVMLQFATSPFGRAAIMATVAITTFNGALNLLTKAGLIPAVQAVYKFIAGLIRIPAATAAARIGVIALRAAITGVVIGAVLVGLDVLAQKILNVGNAAQQSKQDIQNMRLELDQIANAGDIDRATKEYMDANTQLAIARRKNMQALGELKAAQAMELAGATPEDLRAQQQALAAAQRKADQTFSNVLTAQRNLQAARQTRQNALQQNLEDKIRPTQELQKIDLSATEKTSKAKEQSLESLENLADQLAKARTEGEMERANMLFEHKKKLLDMQFAYEESGANEIQQAKIKLAKELSDVLIGYEEEVFKAGQEVQKAGGSVAPGNLPPRAPQGQASYGFISQFSAGANANLRIGDTVGGSDFPRSIGRPVSGSERRDVVAMAEKEQAVLNSTLRLNLALADARKKYALVIKQNFDAIFPIAQMQLENRLLSLRNQLELQGMPSELIDFTKEMTIAQEKSSALLEQLTQEYLTSIGVFEKYQQMEEKGVSLSKEQTAEYTKARLVIDNYANAVAMAEKGLKDFTIVQLENAIASMKQADALKRIEEISSRIDDAVGGVTDTYKTLFKEIATGVDGVEALKKAQDALADQFLTMFFDFAMKPVEDFFKKTLGSIFGVPDEEAKRKETIDRLEAQLAVQKNIEAYTKQTAINTGNGLVPSGAPQAMAGVSMNTPLPVIGAGETATLGSESFNAALSNMEISVMDTASTINAAADEAGPKGAIGAKWQESLGRVVQGIGMAAGSIMGISAGISQIKEGGTSNVLGGIGSIALSIGGLLGGLGGLGGLFGGGGGGGGFLSGTNALSTTKITPGGVFANGGIAKGGFIPFRAFANGGTVQGPTLGLMGEGRYNEAIVPLPDGKSIPVQLGGQSSRDLLSPRSQSASSPVLSMSFQSTTINGVEYVDRAQLEQAMAETRRLAARDGASRGSQLALDKLRNSPNIRRQVGMQ
jgi:tape measure domain-containing protein